MTAWIDSATSSSGSRTGLKLTSRRLSGYFLVVVSVCFAAVARASTPETRAPVLPNNRSPSQGPRLGLSVAGRLKCYLWGQLPSTDDGANAPLVPFFSASRDASSWVEQDAHSPAFKRVLAPSSLFATADYHFQKERWYGLKNVGVMLRWNVGSDVKQRRLLPTKVDVELDHAIAPTSEMQPTESASVCLSWVDDGTMAESPGIKLGVQRYDQEAGGSLSLSFPTVKRINVQWITHWGSKNLPGRRSTATRPMEPILGSNPDWWMPDIKMDPLGILSSENRFSKKNWRGNYSVDFRLKVTTKAPSLVFGSLSDENVQAATMRLECSVCDQLQKPTATTARFETSIVPSQWWHSIREASRLTILHEQYHVIVLNSYY